MSSTQSHFIEGRVHQLLVFLVVVTGIGTFGVDGATQVRAEDGLSESSLKRFTYMQMHMGTRVRLVLYAPDQATAARAGEAAFARVAELEKVMSDYDQDSELMHLVEAAGEGPQPISDDLLTVLQAARQGAERTDGAFDPTIGPLSRVWREAVEESEPPAEHRVRQARRRMGWQHLELDAEQRTAELQREGMKLDLGGIGKGFAADAALKVLAAHGIDRAMVQAEGDIVVGKRPPGEEGWGVRRLTPEPEPDDVLVLEHQAISTSGDTEQYFEYEGKRYAHIVDPRTGWAMTERYLATAVAPDGTTADLLATAATVLGPDGIDAVLERWYEDAQVFVTRFE